MLKMCEIHKRDDFNKIYKKNEPYHAFIRDIRGDILLRGVNKQQK